MCEPGIRNRTQEKKARKERRQEKGKMEAEDELKSISQDKQPKLYHKNKSRYTLISTRISI